VAERSKYEIEPMNLENMRQNCVRSLDIQCFQCLHGVILNVDHLPGDLTVTSFGPRMVCTKCGMVGADVRPNWKERDR
jgi:ribosomal protein S27AE